MSLQRLRIILHGSLEGKTVELNERQFKGGIFEAIGPADDCEGIARFHTASHNCETWIGEATELPPAIEQEKAIVMNNEPEWLESLAAKEADLEAEEVKVKASADGEPTAREQDLIAAINMAEDKWVQDVIPHPSVTKVAEILGDSAVTKEEIVAAVEKFDLVDDSPDVQEAAPADVEEAPVIKE